MISKRLLEIAKMVLKNEVVFDVGSDHALLPCFLIKHQLAKKVYAGDLREGPLNQAKKNIAHYGFEDTIIPVLSDGLEKVQEDVTVVTISGMGYYTVEKILDNANLSAFKQIIVQVNRNVDKLREYISEHHYTILDEAIVYDDFYYEIIAFNTKESKALSSKEIHYGPCLLRKNEAIFQDYLNYQLKQLQTIYMTNKAEDLALKIQEIQELLTK